MGWFNKILVPLDGSKQSLKALNSAINLASETGAEITAFHVIPQVDLGGPRTKTFDSQLADQGKEILRNAENLAKKQNLKIKTKMTRGSPATSTIKFAKSGNFDHIVMSTTGTGSAISEIFGSVSNYVLHKSKIPVYLVK